MCDSKVAIGQQMIALQGLASVVYHFDCNFGKSSQWSFDLDSCEMDKGREVWFVLPSSFQD